MNEFDLKILIEFLDIKLTQEQISKLNEKEKVKKVLDEIVYTKMKEFKIYFLDIDSKVKRNKAIISAYMDGYSQVQIAKHLNLSTSLVSKVIKSGFVTPGCNF